MHSRWDACWSFKCRWSLMHKFAAVANANLPVWPSSFWVSTTLGIPYSPRDESIGPAIISTQVDNFSWSCWLVLHSFPTVKLGTVHPFFMPGIIQHAVRSRSSFELTEWPLFNGFAERLTLSRVLNFTSLWWIKKMRISNADVRRNSLEVEI